MLALLKQEEFDLDNQETAYTISTKDKEIIQIPILNFYSSAVIDLIYRLVIESRNLGGDCLSTSKQYLGRRKGS